MKNFAYSAAALALLTSGGAFAAQLEDQINVTAEVTAACTSVTATDVDFGPASAADVNQDDKTSTITVTCDASTAWTLGIDYGITPQGTIRTVTSSAGASQGEQMDYHIYQDAGRVTPWGPLASGDEMAGTGPGAQTAYFRLIRNSGSTAGNYSDLLTVTLDF